MKKFHFCLWPLLPIFLLTSVSCSENMEKVKAESITISEASLSIEVGESALLTCEVLPEGYRDEIIWLSSNEECVSVIEGVVTGIKPGQAEVTAAAGDVISSPCAVTVPQTYIDEYGINHGPGIEIAGVVWAPVNCGYHKDNFKYGKLYQWGRIDGLPYTEDQFGKGHADNAPAAECRNYVNFGETPEKNVFYIADWDATGGQWMAKNGDAYAFDAVTDWNDLRSKDAHKNNEGIGNPCPEGWRVPSREDFQSLTQGYSSWVEACNFSDRDGGAWFGKDKDIATFENPSGCLFLPCAGVYRSTDGWMYCRGVSVEYWTSTPCDNFAWVLYANYHPENNNDCTDQYFYQSAYALAVRCVMDK